jgi:hypothetical protein
MPQTITRRARAAYYGMVETLDRHIGRTLDAVDSSLGAEPTLIVYTSDCDMIGEKIGTCFRGRVDGCVRGAADITGCVQLRDAPAG